MERGTVKVFNNSRGYGSIKRPNDLDVDFYVNSVDDNDRISLKAGDAVLYEIETNRHRHTAIKVRKC